MRQESPLEKKQYLREMRRQLGSFLDFGNERYTGILLGSFFWVTFHSGYEWNRKITNEKNRAYGFVSSTEQGTCVRFFCTKGILDPLSLVFMMLFCFGLWWLFLWITSWTGELTDLKEYWLPMSIVASVLISIGYAAASHVQTGMTERGCLGRLKLLALLRHPEDPDNNLELE